MIVATLMGTTVQAQILQVTPRLVVNITIDQLCNDYIEHYSPLYSQDGFKKLLQKGSVYEAVSYPFALVDRASAIAAIVIGTIPYYHNITSTQWLDRKTLRPVFRVDDTQHKSSPQRVSTSIIGGELKVPSGGSATVYGLAANREAAVLLAGHIADDAIRIDEKIGSWTTSDYYGEKARKWINVYSSTRPRSGKEKTQQNDAVSNASVSCVVNNAMGKDEVTDFLSVTLSATGGNIDA